MLKYQNMDFEKTPKIEQIADQYEALLLLEPKPITNYVPANAAEQKDAFLRGEIYAPDHTYPKLAAIDFEERLQDIDAVGARILDNPLLAPKHTAVYEQFIASYKKKTQLMQLAYELKICDDPIEEEGIRQEYMALNIEICGAPQENTYRSLLQEKLAVIGDKSLEGPAASLRDELFVMAGYDESIEKIERFKPSDETVEWVKEAAETLYGGMLSHIPDRETFTREDVQCIFTAIIEEEFGEAAADWRVDIEAAKSINVKSTEKRVVIPDNRADMTREALRGLVVHEIGVHVLRSIIGGETNLHPLRNGLDSYYDSEEGLGKVMEQAINGTFVEAGIDHYITAGAAYFDGKDFRELFELKWRLGALSSLKEGEQLTEAAIAKAKNAAYNGTMRLLRGTDELPWFKDLSYYNGSVDMWRHLEEIKGDDTKFMFVLMGKANPANIDHERILYETATV